MQRQLFEKNCVHFLTVRVQCANLCGARNLALAYVCRVLERVTQFTGEACGSGMTIQTHIAMTSFDSHVTATISAHPT
jgi:hypothetical protein